MTDLQKLWQGARRVMPATGAPTSAVLLLHGLGSSADDLIELAPFIENALPQTVFISPNAPFPCDMAPFGRQWFSLREWTPAAMERGTREAAVYLEEMIEAVKAEFNFSAQQIALVGFSQGTMMSLHVAPRLKDQIACVVGLSGSLIAPEKLAEETVSKPPILLVHGMLDPVVPYISMTMAATTLQQAGFTIETETRPMMAHNVDDETLTRTAAFLQKHLAEA